MNLDRDEMFFSTLLQLAVATSAGDGDRIVTETLLDPGRTLLRADGATVLLQDRTGQLAVTGASGQRSRLLAEAGLRHGGPAQVAHGGVHVVSFVADAVALWPAYAAEAARQRIRVVHAVPIAVGENAIGAYTLHWADVVHLSEEDDRYAQSLARMAAVAIVNRRELQEQERRTSQLQEALDSRVVIEQAKGMVAARANITPGRAFELMRTTARGSGRPLREVAEDVLRSIAPKVETARWVAPGLPRGTDRRAAGRRPG